MRIYNYRMSAIDIAGKKFGRLMVIEQAGRARREIAWRCLCECGKETIAAGYNVRHGITRSCGCLAREVVHLQTHGRCHSAEHRSWTQMKQRCNNPKNPAWGSYGGRGIVVCAEWQASFANFFRDMGICPPGLSLDRINNDGNYEPGNCRWADRTMQANNRRPARKAT
jgi:hypothetical protein